MTELERDSREGRDVARDLLLQWIWTLHHAHQPGGATMASRTLAAMRTMVDEQPAGNAEAIGRERSQAISQHALAFLEWFSEQVESALGGLPIPAPADAPASPGLGSKRHWARLQRRRR